MKWIIEFRSSMNFKYSTEKSQNDEYKKFSMNA